MILNYKEWLNENTAVENFLTDAQIRWLWKYSPNLKGTQVELNKGKIDIKGDISLKGDDLTHIILEFGVVTGKFRIESPALTTLANCPRRCKDFVVHSTSLTSLEGAPKYVTGVFECDRCTHLKSLKGCPEKVHYFSCSNCNSLTSLEGAPTHVETVFQAANCSSLKSIKGIPQSSPELQFSCTGCPITSLEGAPEKLQSIHCNYTAITSLKGSPTHVSNIFDCSNNKDLVSLEGSPRNVGGVFSCEECVNLSTLKGGNLEAAGTLNFARCPIENLEGIPKSIGLVYGAECWKVSSLKGSPKSCKKFVLTGAKKLTSLEYGPEEITGQENIQLFGTIFEKLFKNINYNKYVKMSQPDKAEVIAKLIPEHIGILLTPEEIEKYRGTIHGHKYNI